MSYTDGKIQDLQIQLKALNELLKGTKKQVGLIDEIEKLNGLKDQLETFNENIGVIEYLANSINEYNKLTERRLKQQELEYNGKQKIQR